MAHHIASTRLAEEPDKRTLGVLLVANETRFQVVLQQVQPRGFGPATIRAHVTIIPNGRATKLPVGHVSDGDTIGVAGIHDVGLASFRIEAKGRQMRLHYLPDGAL